MGDKHDLARPQSSAAMVDSFLDQAKRIAPLGESAARARLVFALDATMSRQPTWDLACRVQGEMFATAAAVGGLSVQLVYFRGFDECRASRWVADPGALTGLMSGIACRGGQTQIARVLRHVRGEAERTAVKVLVYVGDAMEEPVDALCALAGELGLLGVRAFLFQEGSDPAAATAFKEIARLTGGAYARFDQAAPGALADLLRGAAAYAAGGLDGLSQLAKTNEGARKLLTSIGAGPR